MTNDGNFRILAGVDIDVSSVKSQLASIGKIDIPIDISGSENIKELNREIASLGGSEQNTSKNTKQLEQEIVQLKGQVETLTKQVQTLKSKTDNLGNSEEKAAQKSKELTAKLELQKTGLVGIATRFTDVIGKVMLFGGATQIIGLFGNAITKAKESVVALDEALVEYRKVSDITEEQLSNLVSELGELGETVGRTSSEMTQSAATFRKSGYSDEDVARLAQVSSMFQNVADSELEAGDSASFIISQLKAFDMTAEQAIDVIDKTNEVSNNFAVSSTDISSALTKSSSSLATYGNTIDQTIGLVTAGSEILTNQAGKVGRGLRSVGANIVKMASGGKDLSYQIDGVTKSISLMDKTTGDMKNTYTVLEEISKDWENMSEAEQSALALQLAGKNQIDVVTAVLRNFDTAIDATSTSLLSMGSASAENEKYLDSLAGRTAQVRASFETLVNEGGVLNTFAKRMLEMLNVLLQFADTGEGKTLIALIALTGGLIGLNKIIPATITELKLLALQTKMSAGDFAGLTAAQKLNEIENYTLAGSLKTLTIAWLKSPLGMATIAIAGVVALVAIIDKFTVSVKESSENLKEHSQNLQTLDSDYEQAKGSVDALKKSLEDVNSKIDEINKQDELSITDEEQLENLKQQSAELKYQLGVQEGILEAKQKQKSIEAEETLGEKSRATGYSVESFSVLQGEDMITQYSSEESILGGTTLEVFDQLIDKYEETKTAYQDFIDTTGADTTKYTEEQQSQYKALQEALDENKITLGEYAETVQLANNALDENSSYYKKTNNSLKRYGDLIQDNTDVIKDNTDGKSDNNEETDDQITATDNFNNILKDTNTNLDLASKALKEYNNNGAVNADTLNSLLALDSDLLSVLFDQNGQLVINKESLERLSETTKNKATLDLQAAASADILAYANKNVNEMSNFAKAALQDAGTSAQKAGNKALNSSQGWNTLATEVLKTNKALEGKSEAEVKKTTAGAIKIQNAYKSLANSISDISIKTGKSSGASKGAAKSTSSQTKATKELEKTNKALAKSIDKVSSELKEQKEKLDATVDSLEDQANAIEDVFSIVADRIDEQIDKIQSEKDAFEKQNEVLEEQLELQEKLDALQQAKEKKVFTYNTKTGQWEWGTDVQGVAEAQADLDEFKREQAYQKRLDEYDKEIDRLNAIKEQVETLGKSYQRTLDNELLKKYGINMNNILKGNTKQLNTLSNSYAKTQESIAKTTKEIEKLEKAMNKIDKLADTIADATKKKAIKDAKTSVEKILKDAGLSKDYKVSIDSKNNKLKIKKKASGDAYIRDDGAYLVGDAPNEELVLGKTVNNGTGRVMSLTEGSGVVNAKSTKTLAGILNQLGGFVSSNFGAGGGIVNNSSSMNKSTVFKIDNVNVTANNPNEFVEGLQNFALTMKREAH